ncbi:MAG TPA: hypothetical protein PKJ41_12820 [Bryobacteraceae bacterium]|nr:hypothetical protein [Bryobacteraceae bacterium]HPT27014.1 hypothetical protein [Bryobacteraceae bacterium]
MASYRDQYNPEALHFPGSFASRSFLACAIFYCICLIIGLAVIGTTLDRTVNIALVAVVLLLCIAAWPKEIVLDQAGVTQRHLLGRSLLRWHDIERVEVSSEFLLPLRHGRLATSTLRATSNDGRHRVLHTPRHTDRHRFAFELQRHGLALPPELGHITAPNQSRLTPAREPMPDGLHRGDAP